MRYAIPTTLLLLAALRPAPASAKPAIHIAFLWHMHQPNYWPGEDIVATGDSARWGFDPIKVHTDRTGPYTSWPKDAVGAARAAGLGSCGAQVSLTGSLMENLDVLEAAGRGFANWKAPWAEAAAWKTPAGNPSLDLIGFGYFHPLSALIDRLDLTLQLRAHRLALDRRFPGRTASRGLFPPETAFGASMIPALVDAGIEWVIVDNIHFDRTHVDYPYTSGSNLYPPNRADQLNGPAVTWLQLQGLWAPSQVSVAWGYRPHRARHIDPATGTAYTIVVVPGARYEGNEDGRGGFGALNYEGVLSQLEAANTDDAHPILVVLHHDGDNYGGGSDGYYHGNFGSFVSWLDGQPERFRCTTIQDYLDAFPPPADDVIHVEDGSWSGADNGDPEFLKWNADPGTDGYSPDRHSWAVIAAARNRVHTATAKAGGVPTLDAIVDGSGALGRAWRFLLMAEASDYWYWDGSEEGRWDSHPTRAANLAIDAIAAQLTDLAGETTPPTVHPPQRDPYNPGAIEWGTTPQPARLGVFTYAADVSGLARVDLRYRVADDEPALVHAGEWCSEPMTASTMVSRTNPAPAAIADRYDASVDGLAGHLVDYWVEAEDTRGNVARSDIRRVWIGTGDGGGQGGLAAVRSWPATLTRHDVLTIDAARAGNVHWGVNDWTAPAEALRPAGTTLWSDGKAVETPLAGPGADGRYRLVLGPFTTGVTQVDFLVHWADNTWSAPDLEAAVTADAGPVVSLVAPAAGARVDDGIDLIATAADDGGVPALDVAIDGAVQTTLTARPYEVHLATDGLAAGAHELRVTARAGDGGTATTAITVQIGGGGGDPACGVVVEPGPETPPETAPETSPDTAPEMGPEPMPESGAEVDATTGTDATAGEDATSPDASGPDGGGGDDAAAVGSGGCDGCAGGGGAGSGLFVVLACLALVARSRAPRASGPGVARRRGAC